MDEALLRLVVVFPSLWLGLSAHGAAQAFTARRLGDDTAAKAGRLSLLPLRHFDLPGMLLAPLGLVFLFRFKGFVFGWERPVPVDPAKLGRPKRDLSLIALSGLAAFFAVALLLALAGRAWPASPALQAVLGWGILVNATLLVFKAIPLPGMDGARALFVFLPDRLCYRLNRSEPWVYLTLLLLAYAGALGWVFLGVAMLTEWFCRLGSLPFPVGNV